MNKIEDCHSQAIFQTPKIQAYHRVHVSSTARRKSIQQCDKQGKSRVKCGGRKSVPLGGP